MILKIVNGYVIKTTDFGDDDKIITFFSKEYGKLSIYAPGTRKTNSKNKYSVDLFAESTLEIFKSKRNKLSKLKTGYLISDHRKIAKDYTTYIYASVVADATDMIFNENEKSYSFYELLGWILNKLNDSSFLLKALAIFLFKALKPANAMWELNKCLIDKRVVQNPAIFDFENYGVIHQRDIEAIHDTRYLIYDEALVRDMIDLQNASVDQLDDIDLDIKEAITLIKILLTYYEKILGIWSNSFNELRKLPFLR